MKNINFFFLFIPFLALGNPKNSMKFRGEFKNMNMEGNSVKLIYFPDYYAITSPEFRSIVYESVVKDGKFEFKIENAKNTAYYKLSYGDLVNNIKQRSWRCLSGQLFIMENASNINMIIDSNTCYFYGKGWELARCQYETFEIEKKKYLQTRNTEDFYRNYTNRKVLYDSLYVEKLKILNNYKAKIKPQIYETLKLDFFSDYKINELTYITMVPLNRDYESLNRASLDYYKDYFLFLNVDTTNGSLKASSRSYSKFLYLKTLNDLGLLMRMKSKLIRPSFSQVYESINQSYSGIIREKMLVDCFLNYYKSGEGTYWYLNDALNSIQTPEYKNILQQIKESNEIGGKTPNFKLIDSAGKSVNFDSLKGKILVVDFWFTGCLGCIKLSQSMTPLVNYYKNNANVLFVSVSIDEKLAKWKESIKSGEYTHPSSLNLYTGGLMTNHPIIKYFDIGSFPSLLLIDKNGIIVSTSPPKPSTEGRIKRFIQLIDSNL